MNTSARSLLLCCVAASGLLMLSACGKHDASTEAPAAASTAGVAPTAPVIAPAPASTAPAPSSTSAAPAVPGSAPPAPASTTASTAPAASDLFAVSKVVIGDAVNAAHTVNQPTDTIAATQKAIYASVETSGRTDGATLSARWTYDEGKGQLVSAISQSIATSGPAVTTFKIQNPNAWPEGKYTVEIALDGKPVSTRSFEVKSSS